MLKAFIRDAENRYKSQVNIHRSSAVLEEMPCADCIKEQLDGGGDRCARHAEANRQKVERHRDRKHREELQKDFDSGPELNNFLRQLLKPVKIPAYLRRYIGKKPTGLENVTKDDLLPLPRRHIIKRLWRLK